MIYKIFSTLPTFKPINDFRPGLNILLAQKTDDATHKQTRNRAGKTSLIECIHFLTGAKAGPNSIFRTPELAEHTFGMEFDLNSSRTIVERCGVAGSQVHVKIPPGEKVKLSAKDWDSLLGEGMFGLNSLRSTGAHPPTFRSLFPYFVRRQLSNAFTTPEKQSEMQQNGDIQMALMFLLGLDWQIARDWQDVRDKEKTLKHLKEAAGKGAFGSIIGKAADLRTQLTLQEDRLQKLHAEVVRFQILPEYRSLEIESAELTRKTNDLANANTMDFTIIQDLEKALSSEVPPALDDLETIYREAEIILPDLVKRRYEDVKNFHESVVRNRKDYLSSELEAAKRRIKLRDNKKAQLDKRRTEIMAILKSHGALDQFLKLQGEVGRLESEVESLRQRFEAAEQLEGTQNELEIERNRLTIRLRRDFSEQKERLSEAILAFEDTSRRLYEAAGSMTIDKTANGPLFKFQMQGQRSKGIKNMQIFCFDMMLMRLCSSRQIGPGFLVHDSHLFDGVDGRQVISALRVGAELSQELGFQYIVTMNEDDAFKERMEGFDLRNYVLPTRLTDATEDGGIFGIRFG